MNEHEFRSLQEVIEYCADPKRAHDKAVAMRWPNGVCCPRCGVMEVTFLARWYRWKCQGCKKQFTVKVKTLMEDSPLPLKTWIAGSWLITNAKNGISSCEVARALNITQKSAWFLLHRVRTAMQESCPEMFAGTVECDETFIGGLEKNKHEKKKLRAGRGGVGKEIVMGILERGKEKGDSKVRAKIIPDTSQVTLHGEVRANVQTGAAVMTDAHRGYQGLSADLEHAWVDHTVRYAEGAVHTNSLENFWSLFSRMLHGTYTHIDPRHLQSYVDEQAHRFNNRKLKDGGRFQTTMRGMEGKRLTYKDLTERGLTTLE